MPNAAKQFRPRGFKQCSGHRRWYGEYGWRLRARRQLEIAPLCADCEKQGHVVVADVADHVVPHRGNRKSFEEGELQSLCARHHAVKTAKGL